MAGAADPAIRRCPRRPCPRPAAARAAARPGPGTGTLHPGRAHHDARPPGGQV